LHHTVAKFAVSLVDDEFIRLMAGAFQHPGYQFFRRRYDGKAVGILADRSIVIKLRYFFFLLEEFLGFLECSLEYIAGIRDLPLRRIFFFSSQGSYQGIY